MAESLISPLISMPSGMSEDHRLIRETARRFAEERIAPIATELWEEEGFPYAVWRDAAHYGFSGFPYSERDGGGGGDWLSFVIVLEEFARIDCAIANAFMANSSAATLLSDFGDEAQRATWLRPILQGEAIGAIGLTEPNAGSDASAICTRADREGDSWRLNGAKTFISNSGTEITGPIVVAAVTGTRPDGRKEISNLIVPHDTPGLSYGRKLKKIGWRASSTYELFFDDCRISSDKLLGAQGAGLRQTLGTVTGGRILIAALALGILQGALDRAHAYLQERSAFGARLGTFQALQFKVADMARDAYTARLAIYDAARRKDAGETYALEASMAKLHASECAMRAAHQAVQIHGGYGICSEFAVARAFGDAKVLEIVEGTSEIQRQIIARTMGLGLEN
jgi:short-chain 2-methylacyl-CoA dehydrogenase